MIKMNKVIVIIFSFIFISENMVGQDLLSESFCYFLSKSAPKNERILVIKNLNEVNKCIGFNDLLDFTTELNLLKNLSKNPKYLVEYRIKEIQDNKIGFLFTLYKVHRKGKQVMKGIIGSVDLIYCFDCSVNSFVLCEEMSNFH